MTLGTRRASCWLGAPDISPQPGIATYRATYCDFHNPELRNYFSHELQITKGGIAVCWQAAVLSTLEF